MFVRLFLVMISLFSGALLFSNAQQATFVNYPNKYFVESGSHLGHGIQMALDSQSFETIYSIEILDSYYQACQERFKGVDNVNLILGKSERVFPTILAGIDAPTTFWLDAHFCSWDGNRSTLEALTTSLKEELLAIKNHTIKNHTILIDDVRLLQTEHMEWLSLEDVICLLKSINPDYHISFIDGSCEKDILVAQP